MKIIFIFFQIKLPRAPDPNWTGSALVGWTGPVWFHYMHKENNTVSEKDYILVNYMTMNQSSSINVMFFQDLGVHSSPQLPIYCRSMVFLTIYYHSQAILYHLWQLVNRVRICVCVHEWNSASVSANENGCVVNDKWNVV